MSDIIYLNGSNYLHLRERSCYNHNFYQHKETGEILLEICEEDYNSFEIYREGNEGLDYLGCSDTGFDSGSVEIFVGLT